MMFAAEEFMYGMGTASIAAHAAPQWPHRALPWLAVALAHGVLVVLLLGLSPQARQALGQVIQAGLILPTVLPVAAPDSPRQQAPRPPRPQQARLPSQPRPMLAAAAHDDAAPASLAAAPPAAPMAAVPSATGQEPAKAAPAAELAPLLVPPIFNASYLANPAPRYPFASRRLGEKGRVVLRVHVSVNGRAEQVEIKTSSGFEQLDRAALDAVAVWRFVPARRGEEPVAAWVLVPISFVM